MKTDKFLIVFLFSDCKNLIFFGILGLFQKYFLYISSLNLDIIDIPKQSVIHLSNNYKKAFSFFDWCSVRFVPSPSFNF